MLYFDRAVDLGDSDVGMVQQSDGDVGMVHQSDGDVGMVHQFNCVTLSSQRNTHAAFPCRL
jgi:hypothetical protein